MKRISLLKSVRRRLNFSKKKRRLSNKTRKLVSKKASKIKVKVNKKTKISINQPIFTIKKEKNRKSANQQLKTNVEGIKQTFIKNNNLVQHNVTKKFIYSTPIKENFYDKVRNRAYRTTNQSIKLESINISCKAKLFLFNNSNFVILVIILCFAIHFTINPNVFQGRFEIGETLNYVSVFLSILLITIHNLNLNSNEGKASLVFSEIKNILIREKNLKNDYSSYISEIEVISFFSKQLCMDEHNFKSNIIPQLSIMFEDDLQIIQEELFHIGEIRLKWRLNDELFLV